MNNKWNRFRVWVEYLLPPELPNMVLWGSYLLPPELPNMSARDGRAAIRLVSFLLCNNDGSMNLHVA